MYDGSYIILQQVIIMDFYRVFNEKQLIDVSVWKPIRPCSVPSFFMEGCIEKGLSYFEEGPAYTVLSPHIGGAPDVDNSLYAIKSWYLMIKRYLLIN